MSEETSVATLHLAWTEQADRGRPRFRVDGRSDKSKEAVRARVACRQLEEEHTRVPRLAADTQIPIY